MTVKPTDPLALPGASQAQLMALRSAGVETYLDLARLDPFDPRFKGFGEEFPRWVNEARALVADRVVRRVEVGEAITVRAERLYERELTLKAVASRLGIFPQYVQEEVRAADDHYEIVYRRRLDDPLSLGPWLEYKMNARLYAAYLRSRAPPQRAVVQPASLEQLLPRFMPPGIGGELALALELALVALLSDGLHLALVERGPLPSSLLQRALERATPYLHLHCGSRMGAGELAEALSSGGVVYVEGLERCTGEEALVIGEAVRRGRVSLNIRGQTVEYQLPARVIAVAGAEEPPSGAATGLGRLLSRFPVWIHVGEPPGEEAYHLLRALRGFGEDEGLARYLAAARQVRVHGTPAPPEVEEALRGLFRVADASRVAAAYQANFVVEAAKARCRARLSDTPGPADFEYGLGLLRRVLALRPGTRVGRRAGARRRAGGSG